MAPLAYNVEEARSQLSIGRDKFYKLIREGRLVARKCGKRTLILAEDLQAFARTLPKIGESE